ncbi:hypothetical protein C2L80_08240 [Rubneribacter badeniensis]|nr:hypothetical protein C2L80_08240 [Rubneribacter badeniensis]CVH79911.1 hypothetical protein BN3658_02468 [Coriobacteriaceae bacterium CHKCI002]
MIATLAALALIVLFVGAFAATGISSCSKETQGLSGTWYARATDVVDGSEVWANLMLDGDRWEVTGDFAMSGKLKKAGDTYQFFKKDGVTLTATASKSADGQRLVFDRKLIGFTGEEVFYSSKADAKTGS